MSIVRMGRCASCGTPVLWLRAWGFGEPRPVELRPRADGEVVIDPAEARHRMFLADGHGTGDGSRAGGAAPHRYHLHWPCPAVTAAHPSAMAMAAPAPVRSAPLTVAVVPHTHWDREWYVPFQTFRLRLVAVLDQVLDVLEADASFSHFLLDGQTVMVDDYLEVRPDAEGRIRALAAAGRLALGPWHTQPDEFLVSGETLVRDLQAGIARSAELGGTMAVGYLPDSFGHTAQMPQLLAGAGIDHAVVFRGVPDAVWSTGFWWESPDGSRVRAEHLVLGYTNAIRVADDPTALVARAVDLEATIGARRAGGLLLMNGGDHEPPRPWLGRVVAGANDQTGGDLRFEISGLERFLDGQPVEGLPTWRGELRASGPSTVIMGVTSNHVDVRVAAAAAERALERRAEPLSALFLAARRYPDRLLGLAWRRLLDNAAHDSACACSADEVVDQVLVRYAEARQIGEGLVAHALAALAAAVPGPTLVVANPSGHRRAGAVRFEAAGWGPVHLVGPDGAARPAQVLATRQAVEMVARRPGRDLDVVVDLFGPGRFAGHRVARWRIDLDQPGDVVLEMATPDEPEIDLSFPRAALARRGAEHPDADAGVVLLQPPVRSVLGRAGPVEGFGWAAHRIAEGAGPATAVGGGDTWVANEHVRVEVDRATGTLTASTAVGLRLSGLNRYVDGGDAGDTYNWSPPPDDRLVDRPEAVAVELVEEGPVRARLVVTARYPWPVPTDVRTTVDVLAGEPFVRIGVSFDNAHRDHRLRAHFPLAGPVDGSDAECAFAVVHRGLGHEGNPIEAGLPTYPARRFVDCSSAEAGAGLALVHDGVGEYEVVADGTEVALTLLRSVGFLSRDDGSMRPVGAGPPVATPGAQQLGPYSRSYAILLHRGGWAEAGLFAVADDVLLPLEAVPATATTGTLAPSGARLSVAGAEVTAVLRVAGGLVVRMVRAAADAGEAEISWDGLPARGWTVDLRGNALTPVEGRLALRPWEIATVRLDAA